jgi:PAS domain-containing protein
VSRRFPEFQSTGRGAIVGRTLELEACRKDGQEITVSLALSSVQVKGAWHAVGIMSDIPDQKKAEETLRSTMEELEAANNNLSIAISRANEMPLKPDRNIAKRHFGQHDHEIRTP